ncbi:MAG: hypothetical protein H6741_31655 [Alphaproteobacteria bacterium]|nr:hypothetical protein [Alphaproteobacteria bacterium]MCB9797268.1 hypothetical protein [Alphaproteobacteria bacterium]
MSYSSYEIVQHHNQNEQQAAELARRWLEVAEQLQRHLAELEPELLAARLELARVYLPVLSVDALAEAERLTGFRGFSRRSPLEAMAHEAHVLASTIRQIEADERYQRRRYLVGPHGEYSRALQETQELLAPWEEECQRFEDLEGFDELVEVCYDTPEFLVGFFEARYWRLWAAGDAVCEALGMKDFGDDVLPAYRKVRLERERWRLQLNAAQAKVDEVHDLVQRRDRAEARLPRLPELYLAQCHQVLVEYIEHADLPLLGEWLQRDAPERRDLLMALRRVAGLSAKQRFLQEMLEEGVQPALQDMQQRRAKYARKSAKALRKGNRTYTDRDLDQGFGAKRDKYFAHARQTSRLATRMMEHEDYGAFDLDNDPELWWLEFTGAKPPRTAPGLRRWWDRQSAKPRVRYDRDDERRQQAQAVAKARSRGFQDEGELYVS